MARGTQHLKKRPKEAAAVRAQRSRSDVRRQRRMDEAGMFFPSLRRHAKWVFVLLAVVFAAGFVFFGVGSGSNGLGNVLQNWLNIGQGNSTNVSKLEAKAKQNPKDAQAYRELASAYEGKQKTALAIGALEHYSRLRPADTDALQELAGLYQKRLSDLSTQYTSLQIAPIAANTDFVPSSTTKLGQAYTDTNALADPIDRMVQDYGSQQQAQISQQASTLAGKIENAYSRIVAADPTDATSVFQLAQAAQNAGDTTTAIAYYRKAKKLDPSTYGAAADQAIKQLQPQPTTTTTTTPAKTSTGK